MHGKLNGLTFNRDGTCNIVITVKGDFSTDYERLAQSEIEITLKKATKKRSLDANAYCWVLIDKIAEAMNLSKKEVYRQAITDIGGVSKTVCVREQDKETIIDAWEKHGIGWQAQEMPSKIPGCVNLILYCGSSEYDTHQMALLIDHLVQDAEAIGIETLTPQRKAELLNQWNQSCKRKSSVT